MSPYHHFGLPSKNSGLSTSVDSIVTITTLAEDDIDVVVGRVAGWCGSFDRLLSDPLGLQCFLVSCSVLTHFHVHNLYIHTKEFIPPVSILSSK